MNKINIFCCIVHGENIKGKALFPIWVGKSFYLTLRWHFDFCVAKIGMPQKGLKKDDGVRGRREKISSKFFPFFPDHKPTFIGNRKEVR